MCILKRWQILATDLNIASIHYLLSIVCAENYYISFYFKRSLFVLYKQYFSFCRIYLLDPDNYSAISPNLFRVQKMATGNYYFRHHLDPSVEIELKLKNITWKCITNPNNLEGIVKVRVDHIGNIVSIGEY